MKRSALSGWVGVSLVALLWAIDALAGSAAVVRCSERAFLRRGPGTQFQAYATVENGEQVTVEEVTGTWALVRLANGQSGYVHAAFLFYADRKPVLPSTPTVEAAQAPPPTQAAAPAAAAPVAPVAPPAAPPVAKGGAAAEANEMAQRNVELSGEVESLRREIEALRRNPSAAPSPGDDLVSLRAEVRRLADITDALRSRLDAPSSGGFPSATAVDDPWSTSTVVVLASCALLVGWVLGGILTRREERGRRNRIRF